MCGRCAPHGGCAPGYTGALESGRRQPVYPKGPAYSPDQQDPRLPARPAPCGRGSADGEEPRPPTRPARLKRGLGGSRNVNRRSEASAPPEEQGHQYTSGQKGVLRTVGSKRLFRPFLADQKGARAGARNRPTKSADFAGTPQNFTSSGGVNPPCGKVLAAPKRLYAGLPAKTTGIGKCQTVTPAGVRRKEPLPSHGTPSPGGAAPAGRPRSR